jgi:Uma2 family endonuclease
MASALSADSMLIHDDHYTVEDWLRLPPSRQRVELIDGSFVVSPSPATDHQIGAQRCVRILLDAAPDDLEVVECAGICCGTDVLIPDIVVAGAKVLLAPTTLLDPEHVRAVVEIVSPGNRQRDYGPKPKIYAMAGIPVFIRVQVSGRNAPRVEAFTLTRRGRYEAAGSGSAGEVVRLTEPFAVSFDPAWLVGPRGSR